MDATKSVYMRAMITTLFFTGIRVGAILNLKIKDIDRSSDVWKITLHDKGDTRRTVPVTEIKKALIEYLTNYHPNPKPDEYLWVSNNNRTLGKQIEYASLYSQLRQVKRRVQKFNPDWDKPINPHWFRHSWATLNKNIYPDHILKRLGGWCPDSKAINHYDHLSDSDIEEEFSRINGLTPSTTKKTKWDCHTCNTSNFFTDRYCACGTAQNSFVVEEDSIKTQKEQELTQLIMKRIVQDKDLMLRFQEFCKG
jgi:integrase